MPSPDLAPQPDLPRRAIALVLVGGRGSRLRQDPHGPRSCVPDACPARTGYGARCLGVAWLAALLLATGGARAQAAATPAALSVPAGYTLVWSDEFSDAGAPDPAKWSYDTGRNKAGWYNHELQYYSRDRAENAELRDGRLVITTRK